MYLDGSIDYADISADLLTSLLETHSDQIHYSRPDVSYSYWYLFNFDPKLDEEYEPDNWRIAVNNENFRQSIMHGLDRVNALQAKDANDPESLLSNTITPLGAASASQDYAYYGDVYKRQEYRDSTYSEPMRVNRMELGMYWIRGTMALRKVCRRDVYKRQASRPVRNGPAPLRPKRRYTAGAPAPAGRRTFRSDGGHSPLGPNSWAHAGAFR